MKFNINHNVKVKLTDSGREILKEQHDELKVYAPSIGDYKPIKEIDGWSKWQLWDLMYTFAKHVSMGAKLPYETEIEIIEND